MQGFSAAAGWEPPIGTLGSLTRASFTRAAQVSGTLAELRAKAADAPAAIPFAAALRRSTISIIAEVKRSSPSKGAIAPGLDAVAQACAYAAGGAAAISVLTEPTKFGGSLDDLAQVSAVTGIPVIRKDFIVDPVQLWEARACGASAALLIVRALSPELLPRLVDVASEAGLGVLMEIRDEGELARALEVNASVIGVNNRNLETLIIDVDTAPTLIPHIPADRIAVAESGMQQVEDLARPCAAGADAVLIGSAISAAVDPEAAVRALARVPRRAR